MKMEVKREAPTIRETGTHGCIPRQSRQRKTREWFFFKN